MTFFLHLPVKKHNPNQSNIVGINITVNYTTITTTKDINGY